MINNRYQILKEIGSGGIGKVFKAIDLLTQNSVAIKVLLSQESEHVERFKKEFLLLRKLRHPNIVKVYDFGYSDTGEPYFTMEHIEGEDWTKFLQPLDYSKFWSLLIQVCTTLDFLHSKRIIHGDLKPSNILITASLEGQLTAKFTDFGFAEYENPKESAWWKGTLCYLAPEIIRGEKHSRQADLYSLGVLIYETLFGKRPFDEEQLTDLAKSHLEKDVFIPEEAPVPADLKNLVLRLLEKDPIDRYFSAKEVLSEVEKISGQEAGDLEVPLAESLILSGDFVGRGRELSILKKALNQASADGSPIVLLSGESGIGKIRLLKEFGAWAQVEGASVVDIPLVNRDSVEASQEGFSNLLENISQPLVLICEHLEQIDDSALESLCDLIQQTANKKILVCITLTNEYTSSKKDKRAFEIEQGIRSTNGDRAIRIRLEKLTEAEAKRLVYSMLALKEKKEEIAAAIHRKTNGNPLLIKQLMESLISNRQVERRNSHWAVRLEQIEVAPVPHGFAKEIAGRLGRLSQDELDLLSIASVLGLEFETDMLSEVSGLDHLAFRKHIQNILAERILVQSSTSSSKDKICFVNGFSRDLIYERIPLQKRRNLHDKVGRYLEQKYAAEIENYLDQLANHFYQTGDNERSLKYALLAAQGAKTLGKRDQAINHYLCVLELYDKCPLTPPKSKEKVVESLAEQYEADGDYTKSLYYFQKVLELLKSKSSDNRNVTRIYRKMARIYEKTSDHEKTKKLLHEALSLLNPEALPKEYASVLIDLAWHHRNKCEYHKAIHYLKKAISVLESQQLSKEMGKAFNCMGGVHWSLGNYPQALKNLSKSLEVFQKLGEIQNTVDCYIALGLLLRSEGLPNEALEYSRKALSAVESFSDLYKLSLLENNLALIYIDLNRWDHALECLSKSVELKKRISDLKGLGLSYNNMGLVYLRKGLFDKSVEHLTAALQLSQEIRDRGGVALVYYNLGDLHRCKEEWIKATHYLERSLRIGRELGEETRVAECLLLLGKIAIEQSNFNLGMRNLNHAEVLFSKGRDRFGEAEAQLAVGELALRMGNLQRAERHLDQIRSFIESLNNMWFDGNFKKVYASLQKTKGDKEASLEYLLESAKIFKELEARYELGRTYLEIGKIKLETGRMKEGRAFLCEALNIFEKSEVDGKRKEANVLLNQMKEMQHLEKERIQTFYKLVELLNSIWDTDELLSKSLELVIEFLNAERGAIILYSETDKSFELKVSQGIEPETSEDAIAISRRVLKDVIESDSPVIVENAIENPQFASSKSVIMHNILSILCVPLKTQNRLIGTVYLDHRSLPAVFSSEDVDFLKAFASLIATAIEKSELYVKANEEIFQLKGILHKSYQYPDIIGKSAEMQEIFNLVEKVANSKTSVLISGESGTGKELIAHLIHTSSQRKDRAFIRVNCAALPETILESELFGIEEKTATGVGFRKGKFELADGGTIFLDEVGDMTLSVQAKVLRVLQEKEFERVGGQRPIKVDIRIISATNMDLRNKIEEGTFRKDLYFRLNPIVITVSPLRERKDDIPYFVHYFAKKFSKENKKPEIRVTKKMISALQNYSWPGNVRELEHVIESATLLSNNGTFPLEFLPEEALEEKELVNLDKYGKLKEVLDWVERKKIIQALERNKWNQVKAAEELSLNETTLRRRIKKHKIKKISRIESL